MEVLEEGQFLGYFRQAGRFDPESGQLVYRVPPRSRYSASGSIPSARS